MKSVSKSSVHSDNDYELLEKMVASRISAANGPV
jgi:hypothetical protein